MNDRSGGGSLPIGKGAALVYGVACYLGHWVVLAYLMGFLIDHGVPKTIDRGPPPVEHTFPAPVLNTLLVLIFVALHWLMARGWFKKWWTKFIPHPIERSTFVLTSCLAIGAMFIFWKPIPTALWDVSDEMRSKVILAMYLLGWALAIYATFPINHWDLFGLRQVVLYFRGIPYTDPVGYDSLIYRLIPHPIFVGYAILVWTTPRMTLGHLLLASLLSAFILLDVYLSSVRGAS